MMNVKKDLKMMETTAMRYVNAGGIVTIAAVCGIAVAYMEAFRFGWSVGEKLRTAFGR